MSVRLVIREPKKPTAKKPKKARLVKNPMGSVRMVEGKRQVKTDKGWKGMGKAFPTAGGAGLSAKKVEVHRGGTTFQQTRMVRTGEEAKASGPAGLATRDYGWVKRVAKVVHTTIPQFESMKKEDVLVLKRKLDEGIKKGWKLSGGGDLSTWSEHLGKLAGRMTKSIRLVMRRKHKLAKARRGKKRG